MITTGTTGTRWRATITPSGDVAVADGRLLEWFVAADDRWHVPSREPAVRQRRIDDTPVTETRVRVPTGDVVQRIYSVADAGGITVIEIENESTLPVAVAFSHRDVLTERPIVDVPIDGIDVPADAFALPIGHRSSVRVGLRHHPSSIATLPTSLPTAAQVVSGWLALTERASRFALPEGEVLGAALAGRVVTERCELALGGPPDLDAEPTAFLLACGELVRLGDEPTTWLDDIAEAVARVAPTPGWDIDAGLRAVRGALLATHERRALRDLDRIIAGRAVSRRPARVPDGLWCVPWVESWFAEGGALFPSGWPVEWLGQSIEAHRVPTVDRSTVSIAVRWHGARPALLWEQHGEAAELSAPAIAPAWRSQERTGETLLPEPAHRPDHSN